MHLQGSAVDYASWPIKELRRFLTERGEDSAGCTEKSELVAKVQKIADRGPEGADEAPVVPGGYMFDVGSSLYFSQESGMYYDPSTQGFFQPSEQKWYKFDGRHFVEWKA